jgi:hypothetical protein
MNVVHLNSSKYNMATELVRNIVKKANTPQMCWRTPNSGQCGKCERNWASDEEDGVFHIDEKDLNILLDMLKGYEYETITRKKEIKNIYKESWTLPVGRVTSDTSRLPRIVLLLESTLGNAVITGKVIQAANTLSWSSTCEIRDKIILGLGFKDRGGKEVFADEKLKQIYAEDK